MKRRAKLTRGEATAKDLAQVLDNIGVPAGRTFWVEVEIDGHVVSVCARCGGDLDMNAYTEISGFARPAKLRGEGTGSSIIGREPTGRLICRHCALKVEHGVASGQESLA